MTLTKEPMVKKLGRFARGLPLTLALALWILSYLCPGIYYRRTKTSELLAGSINGQFALYCDDSPDPLGVPWSTVYLAPSFYYEGNSWSNSFGGRELEGALRGGGFIWFGSGRSGGWRFFSFANETGFTGGFTSRGAITYRRISAPYWPLIVLAGTYWAVVWLRRARAQARLCQPGFPVLPQRSDKP